MENIGEIHTFAFNLPGTDIVLQINPVTIWMSWLVIFLLIGLAFLVKRKINRVPGKRQVALELLLGAFINLTKETVGEDWKRFFPLVITLFLFVCLSNWLAIIPGLEPPTSDLNTCLGLGIMVFFIAHGSAIKKKGLWSYIKSYFEPIFIMFPLNIVGEFGKVISHSFRLFGNIFGGGIIISVIPFIIFTLFKWWGIPLNLISLPILNCFFGLFVGTVQALVFSVLALTYIAVARV